MSKPSSPSDMPVDAKLEHMYRRGYVHGVSQVLAALGERLSRPEQISLQKWLESVLFNWSTSELDTAKRPPAFPALTTQQLDG